MHHSWFMKCYHWKVKQMAIISVSSDRVKLIQFHSEEMKWRFQTVFFKNELYIFAGFVYTRSSCNLRASKRRTLCDTDVIIASFLCSNPRALFLINNVFNLKLLQMETDTEFIQNQFDMEQGQMLVLIKWNLHT